jgi:hypothetical protein
MRCKALKKFWLLMTALGLVGVAITSPAIGPSPLAPPKLTACNDEILNTVLRVEQSRTTTYCCINNQEWECTKVRW